MSLSYIAEGLKNNSPDAIYIIFGPTQHVQNYTDNTNKLEEKTLTPSKQFEIEIILQNLLNTTQPITKVEYDFSSA